MILQGAKRPTTTGLYVGAAVLFWMHDDDKPRVGVVQRVRQPDADVVDVTDDGVSRTWNGRYPRLDLVAVSPLDDTDGDIVRINAIPHADDVAAQLALEGAPASFLYSCPRYVFVARLEGTQ